MESIRVKPSKNVSNKKLLWPTELFKWVMGNTLGRLLKYAVLPAMVTFKKDDKNKRNKEEDDYDINYEDIKEECNRLLRQTKGIKYKNFKIESEGIHMLDTIEIMPEMFDGRNGLYVINFNGNYSCYEDNIGELVDDVSKNVVSIGFNYPGVGESTGKNHMAQYLVESGISQVQRLLDQGVRPEQIVLKGFSLGAAIAKEVKRHFLKGEKDIALFQDRTFDRISNFLPGHIKQYRDTRETKNKTFWHKAWYITRYVLLSASYYITNAITKPIIKCCGWEIVGGLEGKEKDMAPKYNEDYVVVHPKKIKEVSFFAQHRKLRDLDGVIPISADVHASYKSVRRARIRKIDKTIEAAQYLLKLKEAEQKQPAKRGKEIENVRKVLAESLIILMDSRRYFKNSKNEYIQALEKCCNSFKENKIERIIKQLKELRTMVKEEHKFVGGDHQVDLRHLKIRKNHEEDSRYSDVSQLKEPSYSHTGALYYENFVDRVRENLFYVRIQKIEQLIKRGQKIKKLVYSVRKLSEEDVKAYKRMIEEAKKSDKYFKNVSKEQMDLLEDAFKELEEGNIDRSIQHLERLKQTTQLELNQARNSKINIYREYGIGDWF